MKMLLCLFLLWAAALTAAVPVVDPFPQAATNYQLNMRTLILTTDPAMSLLPVTMMQAYQQPYDEINLVNRSVSPPVLTDPQASWLTKLTDAGGNPQYNSIVLASSTLGYDKGDGTWGSAMTAGNWGTLWNFTAKYQVRVVVLASSWAVDDGLYPYPGWEKGSSDDAWISFADNNLTDSLLGNVKKTARFKIGQVSEFVRTSYWYYPTYINESASSYIKPFLFINPESLPPCGSGVSFLPNSTAPGNATYPGARQITLTNEVCDATPPNWIAGFTRTTAGREEMHFTVNSNVFGHHGFVLADVWFPWMVRGVWPGQRRIILDTQIDDVFLSTGVYNITLNRQAFDDEPSYRFTGSDMVHLANYQRALNQQLPLGSRFVVQLAVNGLGWYANDEGTDSVNKMFYKYRDEFFWVSHTWSHIDMYCYFSNCEVYGLTKYNDTLWDLQKNKEFEEKVLFFDIPAANLTTWPTFSPRSLVTPRISGLNLSDSIQAMMDVGHEVAVGDNSRLDLKPINIYHEFPTRVADKNGRTVSVIPRWATRIYFDVSLPEESAKEHASIYGPSCIGKDNQTAVTFPWKCNTTTFKYPRDLNIDEMLIVESFEVARNLLAYRHDPYMFHQANLRFFEHNGKTTSLLTMWIDALLGHISSYHTFPIYTIKMDDLHEYVQDRMKRDNSSISGKVNVVNGQWASLTLASNASCTAKVTRSPHTTLQFAGGQMEEPYGLDRTRDVKLDGINPVTILFGTPSTPTPLKPFLPYPPVNHTIDVTVLDNTTLTITNYQNLVVSELAKVEKALKESLPVDFTDVDLFIGLPSSTCKPSGFDNTVTAAYKAFDEASKPAQEARNKNIEGSWYRHMEDAIAEKFNELKVTAQSVVGGTPAEAEEIARRFSYNSIDRMENFATVVIKRRYEEMNNVAKEVGAKPSC